MIQYLEYKSFATNSVGLTVGETYTSNELSFLGGEPIQNFPFGQSESDLIAFQVMASDGTELSSTYISSSLNYTAYTRSYIDVNNVGIAYSYDSFTSDFVIIGGETKSLFINVNSELSKLGVSAGTYRVGIQPVRAVVSSPSADPSCSLVVYDISPTRTEMSIVPTTLALATDTASVEFDTSYASFTDIAPVVKNLINPILSGITDANLYGSYYRAIAADPTGSALTKFYYAFKSDIDVINFITDIYYGVRRGGLRSNGQVSARDVSGIFDQFKNILFQNYESITTFQQLRDVYYSLFTYILDRELNQVTNQKPAEMSAIIQFFSGVLYDQVFFPTIDALERAYTRFFSGYLKNSAVIGDKTIPILNYVKTGRVSPTGHAIVTLKFSEPIPTNINLGDLLWIENTMAAEPVVQNVYYFADTTVVTTKLRGPNLRIKVEGEGNGTGALSTEDVIDATGSAYAELMSKMQTKANIAVTPSVDYRYFENFIHFSSAQARLSAYSAKYANLQAIHAGITDVEYKLTLQPSDVMYAKNKTDLETEALSIEGGFDGYENFLYGNPDWYAEHGKIYGTLSSASLYDWDNMDSLLSNAPDFISENLENGDYATFLNMLGHYFDNIGGYIDGFTTKNDNSNSEIDGISKDLTGYMLESLGWSAEVGNENLPLLLAEFSKDDFEVGSELWKKASNMSESDRNKYIWKRILNNLPFILKSKGTEAAIMALINCYGVPNNLIQVKEYGGIVNNSTLAQDSLYIFDENKFSVHFSGSGEYLKIPWTGSAQSVEFNVAFDTAKTSVDGNVFRLMNCSDKWVLGVVREAGLDWGRAFFSIQDGSGNVLTTTTERVPVFNGDTFSVMLRENDLHPDFSIKSVMSQSVADLYPRKYELFVKRNTDDRLTFEVSASILLSGSFNGEFRSGSFVYVGNYAQNTASLNIDPEAFFGSIDDVRIWELPLDTARFNAHTLFKGSYDTNQPTHVTSKQLFRMSFAYPMDLHAGSGVVTIPNAAFRGPFDAFEAVQFPAAVSPVNVNTECGTCDYISAYPYQFTVRSAHQTVSLPDFGSNKLRNNKINYSTQVLTSNLSSDTRSTLPVSQYLPTDSNRLGVFFSPSDQVNSDIIKFFGQFELGDLIGDPSELSAKTYRNFEKFRELYFNQGGGQIDYQAFLTLVRAYFDKSLFTYIKNLVPARSKLVTGALIEPTILERVKLPQKPVQQETHRNLAAHLSIGDATPSATIAPTLTRSIDIKTAGRSEFDDYNRAFYPDRLDSNGFGIYAENGITYYKGDYWRVDVLPVVRKFTSENVSRKSLLATTDYERTNCDGNRYTTFSQSFEVVNISQFPVLYQYPITPNLRLQTTDQYTLANRTEFSGFTGSISFFAWDQPPASSSGTHIVDAITLGGLVVIRGTAVSDNVYTTDAIGKIIEPIGIYGKTTGQVRISGSYNRHTGEFSGYVLLPNGTAMDSYFYVNASDRSIFDLLKSNTTGRLFKGITDSSYTYRRAISYQNVPAGSRPLNGYHFTHRRYKKPTVSKAEVKIVDDSGRFNGTYKRGLQTQKTTVQAETGLRDNSPAIVIKNSSQNG